MRISLLPLPILALAVLAAPRARAEFNPSIVSSDARWVVYADLNSLRQNPVGKEAIALIQKQEIHAIPLPGGGSLTIDVPKVLATIGSITAYGANFQRNPKLLDGTLVVNGTPDLRKIVEALLIEAELGGSPAVTDVKGLGYSAYAVAAKDGGNPQLNHTVIVAFPPEGMVIVGQSEEKVSRAHDLILGKRESLEQAHGSDLSAMAANAAHAALFAASDVPPEAVAAAANGHPGPHTRILEMTHSISLAIGDEGSKTYADVQLVASDDDSADKLIKILQGMTAMMSLAQSSDQRVSDFINSAQASRDGDRVSFRFAYDSVQLASIANGIMESAMARSRSAGGIAMRGPNEANVERILGKPAGEWRVAASVQPGPGAPQEQWHEIHGVTLTNGAQITVHVSGSEANAAQYFEAVQIKPEDGGPALAFSRKMMIENRRPLFPGAGRGSRLLRFDFPGEDGLYTLRVRYTAPAQGDLSFRIWVKNDIGSDNGPGGVPRS